MALVRCPKATFGLRNYAANYVLIFSAYGIGAIPAGFLAGAAKDLLGSYQNAFWVTGGFAALGIVVALGWLSKPKAVTA